MDSHHDEAGLSPAGEAFAEYLDRVADGENPDFNAFCAQHAALEPELRVLHERWLRFVAPTEERGPISKGDSARTAQLIESLREPDGDDRYEDRGVVGRGGMGEVRAVFDRKLRRTLAIKTLLGAEGSDGSRGLARFLDEARISAQLEHPGIVPIHELGLDPSGRVYFSMPLIRGRDLGQILSDAEDGDAKWTRERLLSSLLRVCEAVSFAHSRGVLHRDLKPANVMVGPFGETYVMDWGLAKVVGTNDEVADDAPALETYRGAESEDSSLMTGHGAIVGTPAYLAPEQAAGERVDERVDVYSIGAMLYELLAGQKPYSTGEGGARDMLAALSKGPPAPLRTLTHDVPAELEAICERAMAWKAEQRYSSVLALGDDLRAYIEGRVVAAHETGALAEFRKWVARNRATAGAIAAALLLAIAGSAGVGWRESVRRSEIEAKNKELELAQEEEARQAEIARLRTTEVLRLSDLGRLDRLEERARALWPLRPGLDDKLRAWIDEAEELLERGASEHEPTLAALRDLADPYTDEMRAADEKAQEHYHAREWYRAALAERSRDLEEYIARRDAGDTSPNLATDIGRWEDSVETIETALAPLEALPFERLTWQYPTVETQWEHDNLTVLIGRLTELAAEGGLLEDVRDRAQELERLDYETLESNEARARWDEAIESIADPDVCPAYGGLRIEPQFGLLPVGLNPQSGMWEFAHLQSGSEPDRDEDTGEIYPIVEMGVVLVLIPGGPRVVGAQGGGIDRPNYDRSILSSESPPHTVDLDPYFLSKYEFTQAQWLRTRGANPAELRPDRYFDSTKGRVGATLLHPIETVSWTDSVETMRRLGLELPTEAQWEAAARAGTDTPWYTGRGPESLLGHVNGADQSLHESGQRAIEVPVLEWDDGWTLHAPVGQFFPNPYGLHDVHGNVSEWCLDDYSHYPNPPREGDGLRRMPTESDRIARGGGCMDDPWHMRVSARANFHGNPVGATLGVRPARALDPIP